MSKSSFNRGHVAISKIDAAERQLSVAIQLFFEERDCVAVHTLASAAHQILADLGKRRGFGGFMRNDQFVRPQHRQRYFEAIKRAENFFKHANTDGSAVLEFPSAITELYLFDAALICRVLTGEVNASAGVFQLWFSATHPDLLIDEEYKARLLSLLAITEFDPTDKRAVRELIEMFGPARFKNSAPAAP